MDQPAPVDLLRPVPRDRPVARYAPSPTGRLHLGNLKTALAAWEACRRMNGIFILRIEDIDTPRTIPDSEAGILDDLRWLGVDWDEGPDVGGPAGPYRQSERGAIYAAALSRLDAAGMTYPCICSRKDLREASAPHAPEGPAYTGTCRARPRADLERHPAGAAIRLRLDRALGLPENSPEAPVEFIDGACGRCCFDLARCPGDFVVRRRDGLWAYQFACAVDDALMGVTHVLRGADLLESTPRQIAVLRGIGLPVPAYTHVPLAADEQGRRLSKRDGSQSLGDLRRRGLSPRDVRDLIDRLPRVDAAVSSTVMKP